MTISYDDFARVDIRVGTIVAVEDFPEARKPAFKLQVDFGAEIGIKKSSAQVTVHYKRDELVGRLGPAILVNFAKLHFKTAYEVRGLEPPATKPFVRRKKAE